ncbi:hypothetical protein Efla_003215 [Eimeria flavescens]
MDSCFVGVSGFTMKQEDFLGFSPPGVQESLPFKSEASSSTGSPVQLSISSDLPDAEAAAALSGVQTAEDSEKSQALSAKYVAYLGCIKDNWSSCHAAKLLDEDLIAYIQPRFVLLSTPLKVRVLTSLLYIKTELREKCSDVLSEITRDGETDPNEWVKKLSRILIPYIKSGRIDLRETDTETAFRIINFLDEQKALNPQQGNYRLKAGLEEEHLCEPHLHVEIASAVAAAASSEDPLGNLLKIPQKGTPEMTLFTAKDNFDNLLKGVSHLNGKKNGKSL